MNIERTSLPTTLEEAFTYALKNCRIVPWKGYGAHIELTCRNHLHLRWSTKNIQCIGARSIFYTSEEQRECDCHCSDLQTVIPEDWQSKIVPIPICKCQYCGAEICEEGYFVPNTCSDCFNKRRD